MRKKIWLTGFIYCVLNSVFSQSLFQFAYNIMNPLMVDGTGYPGHSMDLNILRGKLGFEVDYGKTRKVHNERYAYINPQLKFQFSSKEKSEASKYHYFTAGYMGFDLNKNYTYTGRGENLSPPYWDTLEGAQTYNEYHIKALMRTRAIQIGYEKVTEKHVSGVAHRKTAILNPWGYVIGWIVSDEGSSYQLDYTRTFRFSLFAAPPGWLWLEQKDVEPAPGTYTKGLHPDEKVIMEPVVKNLVGARISVLWTSLKPVGSSFGLEMAMLPGVFNVPGVYGRGFPDDNIYIRVNFGFSIGNSEKN